MNGIEVFANLVMAYEGESEVRSKLPFWSMMIIMGNTAAIMLMVGLAILALSNPTNTDISVFT